MTCAAQTFLDMWTAAGSWWTIIQHNYINNFKINEYRPWISINVYSFAQTGKLSFMQVVMQNTHSSGQFHCSKFNKGF